MNIPDPINASEETWKIFKDHRVKMMMYINGCDFLRAGEAIRDTAYSKQNPVYYHLVCQGLEILMKLQLWYTRGVPPEDSRETYSHDLEKLYDAMIEDGIIKGRDDDMIADLNWWYAQHLLRYPSFHGVFSIRPDPYNVRNLDTFIQQVADAADRVNEIERKTELPVAS